MHPAAIRYKERLAKMTPEELLAHKEKIKEQYRKRYAKNPEQYRAYKRKYIENNKEKLKERYKQYRLKYKANNYQHLKMFDITKEQYLEMLEQQKHVCAICGGKDKTRRLAVDHCHTTGVIRGLLCSGCNTSLGQFKDSVELLQKAIQYLKDNNGNKPNAIIVKKAPRRRIRSRNSRTL